MQGRIEVTFEEAVKKRTMSAEVDKNDHNDFGVKLADVLHRRANCHLKIYGRGVSFHFLILSCIFSLFLSLFFSFPVPSPNSNVLQWHRSGGDTILFLEEIERVLEAKQIKVHDLTFGRFDHREIPSCRDR